QLKSFNGLVGYSLTTVGFAEKPDALPQMKLAMYVSGNFFDAMGVPPILGRGFRADEDQVSGRDAVVVLSYKFWKEQMGGRTDVVGQRVRLTGTEFVVVGVAPEKFVGMDQFIQPAVFVPLHMSARLSGDASNAMIEKRDERSIEVKGHLVPGVSIAQAQAEATTVAASLERTYPDTNKNRSVAVKTELEARIENSTGDAAMVAILSTLVMLVLLVACANVANLLLSRAHTRTREIAVRLAIGAGRARLVRQLLTESFVIALGGGLAGLLFAWGGTTFLRSIEIPSDFPISLSFQFDRRVLMVSMLLAFGSALVFGLAPAIQATRAELVPALKATVSDSGRRRIWGRNALVVMQVAFSLVVLVAASALYRGFGQLMRADPGFRHSNLLMMKFDPKIVKYKPEQIQTFYRQLSERVRATPGVEAAALMTAIPLGNNIGGASAVPEGFEFQPGKDSVGVMRLVVDENFFQTLNVSIVQGRAFLATDTPTAPLAVVVNEVFAAKYWPNQNPIGKRVRVGTKEAWSQVVGVAKNYKYNWIGEPPMDMVYQCLWQMPDRSEMTLMAYTPGDPLALVEPMRQAVRALDANQPIYNIRTYDSYFQARAIGLPNALIRIVGSMGLVGLLLAMIGLYGLMAYSVAGRTREIGIRMAIGQDRRSVLGMVMRQGLVLAVAGIGIGLVGSYFLGPVMASGSLVPPDTAVYVVVPLVMLAVTALAVWIPSRRAARVDPMVALRYE
ncbi:MAG: ABC transporter permease, partial [Bryobacteraceae bacterium]